MIVHSVRFPDGTIREWPEPRLSYPGDPILLERRTRRATLCEWQAELTHRYATLDPHTLARIAEATLARQEAMDRLAAQEQQGDGSL